jgi:predicted TIM-barrel fold metal-dependent hydrolase
MARQYRVISADSHLEISPERWRGRVPAKFRDRAPRLVKLANGGDGVIVENRPLYVLGLAITGKPPQEHRLDGISYETGPGAGPPEQRLEQQDRDGVDAEVLFTSAGNGGFWRGIRADDAYKAVIHAYNEFLAEEYCATAPDRLLATGIIPNVDVSSAVAEMEYCARAGLKSVALSMFPSGKTFPTEDDDRFYAAALDLNMPLTIHVGFIGRDGPVFRYQKEPSDVVGFGSDPVRVLTRFGGGTAQNALQMVMFGVFDRFPKLRIYIAETMIGWFPYFCEQTDDIYERNRYWAESYYGLQPLKRLPSEYVRDHIIWGFLNDPIGVRQRHEVGIQNAMWGSDFPHSAGDWPHSLKTLDKLFNEVPDNERHQMVAGNAIEFFHLDAEPIAGGNGRARKEAAVS